MTFCFNQRTLLSIGFSEGRGENVTCDFFLFGVDVDANASSCNGDVVSALSHDIWDGAASSLRLLPVLLEHKDGTPFSTDEEDSFRLGLR